MELRHTEKLILDKDDASIWFTQMPIYDIIHIRIDWHDVNKINDGIYTKGKRIVFPYEIPCEYDVYVTYLTDDWNCWECLYMSDLVRRFYNILYGTDNNEYIDGYEEDLVKDYIAEALMVIRNMKADYRSIRQYSFQLGIPIQNFSCHDTRCRTTYRDTDFIPQDGLALTSKWVYIGYQVVWDKIKFEKQTNIDTDTAYFGYKLPNMGYIHSVRVDGRPVDFCEYQGYYFFPKLNGIVTIEYFNDIVINDDCCIEFDEKFARLPVLYAIYNTMLQRGDSRAAVTKQQFDALMDQYKLYLRRQRAKDANSTVKTVPPRKRTGYMKSISGSRYVNTDLI